MVKKPIKWDEHKIIAATVVGSTAIILNHLLKDLGGNKMYERMMAKSLMEGCMKALLNHYEWKLSGLRDQIAERNQKIEMLEAMVEKLEKKK